MTTVKFIGVPGESHDSITMYGLRLPLGKAVKTDDPLTIRKLKNHPHFTVDEDVEDAKIISETPKTARAALEQLAEARGIKVDGRWSDARLAQEMARSNGLA